MTRWGGGNLDIYLEDLELSHVRDFLNWGKFEDPLLSMYNFNEGEEGLEDWYRWKTRRDSDRYFSILKGGRSIGYIGIKGISPLTRSGDLGVILDPALVNQGYGTQAMRLFLSKVFNQTRLDKVTLEVLPWNLRALHVYKKLGFKEGQAYFTGADFPISQTLLEALTPYRNDFKQLGPLVMVRVIRMSLIRADAEVDLLEL